MSASFHHLPASEMEKLTTPLEADVLVCSDHAEATAATVALVDGIDGLRGVDAGSLAQAAPIEAFTAVLITINIRHKVHAAVQLTGYGALSTDRVDGGQGSAALRHGPGKVVPLDTGPVVTMYSCGITPYDSAHLGHAQVYLTFDILQRRLRDLGPRDRAACATSPTSTTTSCARPGSSGSTTSTWPPRRSRRFDADMAALGLIPAWSEPRATSAIAEILTLIGSVLDSGHAYQAGGAVYFDVTTFAAFGAVSHFDPADHAGPGRRARRATPTTPTSATRSTSSCGSRRCPTSRRGSRGGDRAGPGGTSSARPWPCASWARPSTSTAAAAT